MSIELVPWPAGGAGLLERWIAAPHVVRWWKPALTAGVIAALRAGDAPPAGTRPWRIDLDGVPVGYAQDYDPARPGDGWSEVEGVGAGTRGLELLIGEADAVNRRHGRAAIRLLAARLFAESGTDRLVSGPHPDNWPAVIAFKRAGFRERGRRQFPSGPVMVLTAARAVWSG